MKTGFHALFCAFCLFLILGCTTGKDPKEYDAFKTTPMGLTVCSSLRMQGFPMWNNNGGLSFILRSRTVKDGEMITIKEKCTLDLNSHRAHLELGNLSKFYAHGGYWEVSGAKTESLQGTPAYTKIMNDYLFTALPFILAQTPVKIEEKEDEEILGIRYHVIQVIFQKHDPIFGAPFYDCYFSYSTKRLERVFFKRRDGRFAWCEFDNFFNLDGLILPLHRKFTHAMDEKGNKIGQPYLEQWIVEPTLHGSVDQSLFVLPSQ